MTVRHFNPDISVSGDGTSWAEAWKTDGDIVWSDFAPEEERILYLSGGAVSRNYDLQINVGRSGTSDYPMQILIGQDVGHDGQALFDGEYIRNSGIFVGSYDYVTISGEQSGIDDFPEDYPIAIERALNAGIDATGTATSVKVFYVEVADTGGSGIWEHNIHLNNATGCEVGYCYLHGAERDGFTANGSTGTYGNNSIHHCKVLDCNEDGVNVAAGFDIYECIIGDMGGGSHADGIQTQKSYIRVWNNVVYQCHTQGIYIDPYNAGAASHMLVFNNLVFRTDDTIDMWGIKVDPEGTTSSISYVYVINNTVADCGYSGTFFDNPGVPSSDCIEANNLVINCARRSGAGAGGDNGQETIDYNCIVAGDSGTDDMRWDGTIYSHADFVSNGYGQANGTTSTPSLVSYAENGGLGNDMHLQVGDTVCRGAGYNYTTLITGEGLATADKDGVARPTSGMWDIGCFQYEEATAPTVTDCDPGHGVVAGGDSVTLTGTNFTTTPDTSVTFGGTAATNVAVVNSETVTCDTPAKAAAVVDVVVTNSNGSGTLTDGFEFHDPPDITSIAPEHGQVAGGESVTLTGTDFSDEGTTTVTFGGTAATNVVVVNSTTITCTTPAKAAGQVDVVVTNDFGNDTLTNGFEYHDPPTVTLCAPDNGPVVGGTSVTLTGTNFTDDGDDTVVTFGGVPATSVVIASPTSITCDTPAHDAGDVDIVVTNDFGADTLTDGFTYNPVPVVDSVVPADGNASGGDSVTIYGTGFTTTPDTDVEFDGDAATNVVVVSATEITCDTPAHAAGMVDVEVANSNGADTLENAFTYVDAPTITDVDPDHGTSNGDTLVTVTGTNFTPIRGTTITFGGVAATEVAYVSPTEMTCKTPAHAAGDVDVVVTTSYGTDTLVNGYEYADEPEITSTEPEYGPINGNNAIIITGTGFTTTEDTIVLFGTTEAIDLEVVNPTTITCKAPPHPAGIVEVIALNSNMNEYWDYLEGTYPEPI